MSVYTGFLTEGTKCESLLPDINSDELVNSSEIDAAFEESSIVTAARIVAENTTNWNTVLEACAITEFACFEESGTELVYEAGTLAAFKDKVIAVFNSIWEKIKAMFKKVLLQFNSWTQSDKDFVKKYQKELNKAINGGFEEAEVDMYNYKFYSNPDLAWANSVIIAKSAPDSVEKMLALGGVAKPSSDTDVEGWRRANTEYSKADTTGKILDEYRAGIVKDVIGTAGKEVTAKEFVQEIKEGLQGDSTKDSVKLGVAVSQCMPFLTKSDKVKKGINDNLKANKKAIDDAIRAVERIARDLDKGVSKDVSDSNAVKGAQHSIATKGIGHMKAMKDIQVTLNGVCLECLKACSRQSKAICVKALTYTAPKNESGDVIQNESVTSLIDGIKLV